MYWLEITTFWICICRRKDVRLEDTDKLHRDYIKEHKSVQYTNQTLSCKLCSYLADVDEQAEERLKIIMKQMTKMEGVTEQLKADNQVLWIRKMNNIRHRAEEIVLKEIVYS
jgi:DNA helicase IV